MLRICGFHVQMFSDSPYQVCTIAQDVLNGFVVLFAEPALCIRGQTHFSKVIVHQLAAANMANKEVKRPNKEMICPSLNKGIGELFSQPHL